DDLEARQVPAVRPAFRRERNARDLVARRMAEAGPIRPSVICSRRPYVRSIGCGRCSLPKQRSPRASSASTPDCRAAYNPADGIFGTVAMSAKRPILLLALAGSLLAHVTGLGVACLY